MLYQIFLFRDVENYSKVKKNKIYNNIYFRGLSKTLVNPQTSSGIECTVAFVSSLININIYSFLSKYDFGIIKAAMALN